MTRATLALVLLIPLCAALSTSLTPAHAKPADDVEAPALVRAVVTWYPITGYTACGGYTRPGTVACSYNLPCGTIVHLGNLRGVCDDRGNLYPASYGYYDVAYWVDWWMVPDINTVYGMVALVWFEYP